MVERKHNFDYFKDLTFVYIRIMTTSGQKDPLFETLLLQQPLGQEAFRGKKIK